jgi:hypothetical protein
MSRILMTTDARPGIWGFSAGVACALGRLGHGITLVSLGSPT